MNGHNMQIPGQRDLFGSSLLAPSVLLLAGPPGSGKTMYAIQFLRGGLSDGISCIYINCSQGFTAEKFNSYFVPKKGTESPRVPVFHRLSLTSNARYLADSSARSPTASDDGNSRMSTSDLLRECIEAISSVNPEYDSSPLYIVVDSLTDLAARISVSEAVKFVASLYDFLKARGNVMALLLDTASTSTHAADTFGSLVDGVVQLRMVEDSDQEIRRDIRMLSIKGTHSAPKWVKFQVREDGTLQFGDEKSVAEAGAVRCKLCDRPVIADSIRSESGFVFHPDCFDTYRKLGDIYGSNPLYTLQPGVVNANFFFIDIVGLSDPLLSVEKQIRKIEDLNALIGACDAFSKVPNDAKIVLPTGDGMVIGFMLNPELPLQLSMQLHRRLRAFNAGQSPGRAIGVRIGLSTGPVFVVSDINNNQNVWGPGIILARRVMDLGDDGHILLADSIAETLTELKDEYRAIIKLVSNDCRIKHGQRLGLYSAYSDDFGNPLRPSRIGDSV